VTDASVVFNAIGKDSGATDTIADVGRALITTGQVGAAAMKEVDHQVNKLDHDIDEAKRSIKELAAEFALATAGVERNDISAQIRKQSSELSKLTKVRDLLEPDAPKKAEAEGRKISEGLSKGLGGGGAKKAASDAVAEFSETFEEAAPQLKAAAAVALAASLPFIGTVIAGAVVGVAGIGGIAGGVALAARDPRVQAGWKQIQMQGSDALEAAAKPFVPAVLAGLGQVQREIPRLQQTIAPMFASLSKYVAPLTDGVLSFVDNFAHGFSIAAQSAGPVVDMISKHLGELGTELGNLFSIAGKHAQAGAQALGIVFDVIEELITVTAGWIDILANVYEWLSKIGHDLGADKIGAWLGIIDDAGPTFSGARKATDDFKGSVDSSAAAEDAATKATKALYDATNQLADSNLSAYEAQTKSYEAVAEATAAIKKNGEATDVSTKKGQANRDTLSSLAGTMNQLTDANDKAGASASKSIGDYERQRAAFVRVAEAAGYSKKQANDLADQILKIPKAHATNITADAGGARNAAAGVAAALAKIPRQITVRIVAKAVGVAAASAAIKLAGKLAGGGPMQAGLPYLVGEEGPELVVPDQAGTVMPADKTRSTLASARGTHGSGSVVAARLGSGGGGSNVVRVVGSDRLLVELVRRLIRTNDMTGGAIA
jgi:hypothetical protein